MPRPLRLYGYWRSMAAYRVRVALLLKGLAFEEVELDLDAGDQFDPEFVALNPEAAVPALVEPGGAVLTQSLAILEFLEERWPDPPLLPRDPLGRARVRSLAALAVSDTHPLIVPRVRNHLARHAGFDAADMTAWNVHWLGRAADAAEAKLARDPATGAFCHGDSPTFADICLGGLFVQATRMGYRLTNAPVLAAIVARCQDLEAFQAAVRTKPD